MRLGGFLLLPASTRTPIAETHPENEDNAPSEEDRKLKQSRTDVMHRQILFTHRMKRRVPKHLPHDLGSFLAPQSQ